MKLLGSAMGKWAELGATAIAGVPASLFVGLIYLALRQRIRLECLHIVHMKAQLHPGLAELHALGRLVDEDAGAAESRRRLRARC